MTTIKKLHTLITRDGILLMKTCEVNFTKQQKSEVKMHVKRMSEDEKERNLFYFEIVKSMRMEISPVLIMNEGMKGHSQTQKHYDWTIGVMRIACHPGLGTLKGVPPVNKRSIRAHRSREILNIWGRE